MSDRAPRVLVIGANGSTGTRVVRLLAGRDGAVKSMVAAEARGVDRYVMLSSRGADPESEGERLSPYYRAKGHADVWLRRSDLIHTIVRPGRLTEDGGTGRLELAPSLPSGGSIPRDDVARVLVESLEVEATRGETFAIVSGPTPIDEALAEL